MLWRMCLDSIDQHIINTEVNVQHGNQHLTKAVTYQVAF
jgi:t-SNARE complex subunit (syntaxin)